MKNLKDIIENRKIVLARELTKIHEEFIRKDIDELIEIADDLKGEIVLIIEKNNNIIDEEKNNLLNLSLDDHYEFYLKQRVRQKRNY